MSRIRSYGGDCVADEYRAVIVDGAIFLFSRLEWVTDVKTNCYELVL